MEESILKKATLALALVSIAALGSGIVRAETDETTWTYTGSNGATQSVVAEEIPEVLALTGTAELPRVTVTCSKVCQANGVTAPSGLDFVNVYPTNNVADRDGDAAPSPAPPPASAPPPPPKTRDDCVKDCDFDRKVRDLKCKDEAYALWQSLYAKEMAAARMKLINKGIKNPLFDADIIPDAILLEIKSRQDSFQKLCDNVADQAQLWCYTQVCAKLSGFYAVPFLLAPAAGKRRRKNDA